MLWFVGYWIFFGLWPKQNAGALPPRVALRAALSVRGAGCLDFLAHKRVLVNCSKSVSGVVVEVFGTMLVVFSSSSLDRWVVSTLGFVVLHGGVIFFFARGLSRWSQARKAFLRRTSGRGRKDSCAAHSYAVIACVDSTASNFPVLC